MTLNFHNQNCMFFVLHCKLTNKPEKLFIHVFFIHINLYFPLKLSFWGREGEGGGKCFFADNRPCLQTLSDIGNWIGEGDQCRDRPEKGVELAVVFLVGVPVWEGELVVN